MPRTAPVAEKKVTYIPDANVTYEELYPGEYKPGEWTGPLPDDPRALRPITSFLIAFDHKEERTHRGGMLYGPTAILWDVLEYVPTHRGGICVIREFIEGIGSKTIYRWHKERECWRRVARGPANG